MKAPSFIAQPPAWLLALALLVLTATLYAPVRHYAFVNIDDPDYVIENPRITAGLTGEGFIWAWTATHVATWHPLTTLSHMLCCQLFGLNPGPHHLVNVVLHLLSTLLLFTLLSRATGQLWPSVFVAALFAVHPLRVESVAWISELKDVLSTFFWMLGLWAYVMYVGTLSAWRYALVLLAFAAALLSKPMAVTFPFALLLLDVWPLGRWAGGLESRGAGVQGREGAGVKEHRSTALPHPRSPALLLPRSPALLLLEKLPLILMAGAFSALHMVVHAGATVPLAMSPVSDRIANILKSYAIYILKMLWPTGLAVFYPFDAPLPVWQVAGAALFLLCVTALVFRHARAYPYLPVGWLWYVGTLVPVIGLVRAGLQARADRFTYIPSIGIFIIAAWGVPDLLARWRYRQVACAFMGLVAIAACSTLTAFQLEYWRDGISLFRHAVDVTRDNEIARQGLAGAYLKAGRHDEWLQQVAEIKRVHLLAEGADYARILEANPADADAHFKLGVVRAAQGDRNAAMAEYIEAIRLDPNAAAAHANLGALLVAAGNAGDGVAHLEQALRLDPDDAVAHFNLGTVRLQERRLDDAESHLTAALRIRPDYAEAHCNLGFLFFEQGRVAEAKTEFREALRIREDYPEAHTNLGMALAAEGQLAEAIAHYEAALRLQPEHAAAHHGLGLALARQGQEARAIAELQTALRLNPGDDEARQVLEHMQVAR